MRKVVYPFCLLLFISVCQLWAAPEDPLASEIERWKNFLQTNESSSENWKSIREMSLPLVQRAEAAVATGKRNLAIHLLAALQTNLAAQKYVQERHVTAETKISELEEEWTRVRNVLQSPQAPRNLERLNVAARAVAEAAHSEIKVYYEASLEYGKNTMPEYGFFYIGLSQGQLAFTEFLDRLSPAGSMRKPELPGLRHQIDQLEDKLLAEYKPPASIDQHSNFIRASALIKHAHELYDAGLHYGALYRILYARQILSKITSPGKTMEAVEASQRSAEVASKLKAAGIDHSLAFLFLELAGEEPHNGETARAVFDDILPVYFSSLEPSPEPPQKEAPAATVTLVRWPYT